MLLIVLPQVCGSANFTEAGISISISAEYLQAMERVEQKNRMMTLIAELTCALCRLAFIMTQNSSKLSRLSRSRSYSRKHASTSDALNLKAHNTSVFDLNRVLMA